jgi:hypothetical protein
MPYYQNVGTPGAFGSKDIMGNARGSVAGSQMFAYNMAPGAQAGMYGGMPTPGSSSSSSSASSTASLPPSIAPPSLSPFNYSTESQSYPTYLRNLGENQAQRAYQQTLNRATMGNSNQQFQHATDALNTSRLAYMGQAGQEELGIQNALASSHNEYQKLLAQLYGYQVGQRGQDVNYADSQNRIAASNAQSQTPISIGGSRNPLTSSQLSGMGSGSSLSLSQSNAMDSLMGRGSQPMGW